MYKDKYSIPGRILYSTLATLYWRVLKREQHISDSAVLIDWDSAYELYILYACYKYHIFT